MEPHYQDPTVQRPAIFNFLARQGRNLNTKRFLNQLLVHVALSLKDDSGKPHAPVTVAVNMRTLFAEFKRQELPWKMEDFKGWEGAFCDVVDQVFNEYLKRDDTYGVKKRKEFTDDDHAKITLFIAGLASANERLPWLRHIANFCLGTQFGFRGRSEHRDLKIKDISFGVYPLTATKELQGKPYVQIGGKMLSKANKLSLNNPSARESVEGGTRFFHDTKDPCNVGHALYELLSHCHLTQEFLHHHNLSKKE